MIKKWLPNLIGLSIFALLGRLLGFVREILMASKFGANEITDAYLTTLLLFDIAVAANMSILSGTLSFSTEVKNLKYFFQSLINVGLKAFIIVFAIAVIYYPLADKLIPLIFPKSLVVAKVIIETSRLFLILAAFLIASGVFSALLQMKGNVTNPGKLIIFLNISSIAFLIFYSKTYGIISLPLGFLLGGMLFFIYQIFLIRKKKEEIIADNNEKNKLNILGWSVVVLLIFGNSLLPSAAGLLERYFAYSFVVGTFSHYQYAAKIIFLPLTIFSFAISTSLLPIQTKSIGEGNKNEFMKATNNGILFSVVTSSFFVLLFFLLSHQIIQIIYQHGHFNLHDSAETSHALRIMSVGLIPFLLNPVIANIYYSMRTVKNIIAINLFFILIQFIVLLFFSKIFTGIETLTVTWVIIVWTNNFALIYFLARYKDIHFNKTIVMKLFLVLLTTAALIILCKNFVDGWFGEANALQSNLHLLLKVSGAGIILLLVFIIGISFVFYDRLDGIIHYFKKNRE